MLHKVENRYNGFENLRKVASWLLYEIKKQKKKKIECNRNKLEKSKLKVEGDNQRYQSSAELRLINQIVIIIKAYFLRSTND